MTEELDLEREERDPRPGFLTVLSVLSFVNIGLGIIFQLIGLAGGPMSEDALIEQQSQLAMQKNQLVDLGVTTWNDTFDQMSNMLVEQNDAFYLSGMLTLITLAVGLYGVIQMFKGFKRGFHFYIIYCILATVSMYAYVSPSNIPSFLIIIMLILSGLFVGLYAINLKWMK